MVVIPLAFLLRAAKVPAVAFTFVSNHFSIIVLYPLQCYLGSYLISGRSVTRNWKRGCAR